MLFEISLICMRMHYRPESIMFQNLPIMHFPNFLSIMLVFMLSTNADILCF